jgi:hypothetical protein
MKEITFEKYNSRWKYNIKLALNRHPADYAYDSWLG